MKVRYFVFLFFQLIVLNTFAQNKNKSSDTPPVIPNLQQLKVYNDSLKVYNDQLVNAANDTLRSAAALKIIKTFSKALRQEGSFHYEFDSLNSIAILTPDDKKFRIFTWQLMFDNGHHRYFGVIQSNDNKPTLQPLVDYGDYYKHVDSVIVDADRWIGALYYQIIPKKSGKTTYYTLLGWDANNPSSNKKLIEILWFDKDNKAKFGFPLFEMAEGKTPCRVVLEYKKDASLSLNYYADIQQIYFDHLTSLSGGLNPIEVDNVPDGTLEAFQWNKGKWRYVDIVDYERRKNGDVPNVISEEQKRQLYQPLPPR